MSEIYGHGFKASRSCYTELRAMAVLKYGTSHLDDFGIIYRRAIQFFLPFIVAKKTFRRRRFITYFIACIHVLLRKSLNCQHRHKKLNLKRQTW